VSSRLKVRGVAAPEPAPQHIPEHPVQEAEKGFRFVLRQPAFRLIWFAQLASQVADKFLMFSLLILAYQVAGGSSQVAFTLLSYTIPAVLIAPLAGVFADRHDRKQIMVFANFLRAGLITLIPLASLVPLLSHDFWHLLLITFAISATGQVFSPSEAAAIPSVLPKRALLAANSLVMVTLVLTLMVGGALAPILSGVDLYLPYWVAALLFAAAGLCILLAHIPRLPPKFVTGERLHPFKQVWVELLEGVTTLRNSPVLMIGFGQLSTAVLVLLMMFTLAPAYVKTVLGIPPQQTYVILVPAIIGAIISAALLSRMVERWSRTLLLFGTLLAMGATLVVLAAGQVITGHFPLIAGHTRIFGAICAFVLGLEFGSLMIPALTYLMEHTTDVVRGRVFALLFMVINGVAAIPILAAAVLADIFGTTWVIAIMGVLLVLPALGALRYAPRAFAPART
jgi:MFS family permease